MSPGFFNRIRSGLTRTRTAVVDRIADVVGGRRLDDDTLEAIEEILISADVGLDTSLAIVDGLRTRAWETPDADVFDMLQAELEAILAGGEGFDASLLPARPYVLLVVGVNGVGKTTTIGKLGQRYAEAGRKVIMAAGDTFRAGAVSQLQVWAE